MSAVNESERYFIRRRGRISGPFDHLVIVKMVKNGKLYKSDEISIDQEDWDVAGESEFFPKPQDASLRREKELATSKSKVVEEPDTNNDNESYGFVPNTNQPKTTISAQPPTTSREWYYALSDQSLGPVNESALKQQIMAKTIGPKTKVWCDGMADWEEADTNRVFKSYFEIQSSNEFQNTKFCESCGKRIATNAMICVNCGVQVSKGPKLKQGSRSINVSNDDDICYATFAQRVGAEIIDLFVGGFVVNLAWFLTTLVVGLLLGIIAGTTGKTSDSAMGTITLVSVLVALPVTLFAYLTYYVFPVSDPDTMATLGKRSMGIYVCRTDGSNLTGGAAFSRLVMKNIVVSFTLGLAYLIVLFTQKKQGLHDLMVDSVVLRRS